MSANQSSCRLFIIEGLPSFVLGVFTLFFLADSPESAWYLTPEERRMVVSRRKDDQREAMTPSAQQLNRSDVVAALKDWKIWAFCAQNFGADILLFSYAIFLPTIIQAINSDWSVLQVQALTIPCYAWSCIVYFMAAFVSDATQHRASFGIFGCSIAIVGNVMLLVGKSVAVQYAGCFVIATGLFLASGLNLLWLPSNCPRYGKRATAIGLQLAIGDSAGLTSPYVRLSLQCWQTVY